MNELSKGRTGCNILRSVGIVCVALSTTLFGMSSVAQVLERVDLRGGRACPIGTVKMDGGCVSLGGNGNAAALYREVPRLGEGLAQLPASDGNTKISTCGKPADPSSKTSDPSIPATSHPVAISTGEKFLRETDFSLDASAELALQRTYRSRATAESGFGANWQSSLNGIRLVKSTNLFCWSTPTTDPYLERSPPKTIARPVAGPAGPVAGQVCVPKNIIMIDSDGVRYRYLQNLDDGGRRTTGSGESSGNVTYTSFDATYSPSNGQSESGEAYIVARTGEVTLSRKYETYKFDSAGRITTIQGRNGLIRLTYTYTADGLSNITDATGRSIRLTWANGRIATVTAPNGKVWSYGYNANNMLTSVSYAQGSGGAQPVTRTYLYTDPSDPSRSLGKIRIRWATTTMTTSAALKSPPTPPARP